MHFLTRLAARAGAACAAALLWCSPAFSAPPASITVTDLAGRTVTVPAQVDRILLGEGRLLPALAILEQAELPRRLVGMMGDFESLDAPGYRQWSQRFPQLDKVARVGRNNSGSFSDEQAIALRPQVAILGLGSGHGPSQSHRETLARLEAAGIAVVFIDFRHDPLRNTPRSLELLGQVLGKRKEAEAFVTTWKAELERVQSRLRTLPVGTAAPTVFLENRVGLADECCATMVGLVGMLLDGAGGKNVAKGLTPGEHGTLNPELLLAQQPRIYIGTGIGNMGDAQKGALRIVLGADATPEAARQSLARANQRRGINALQAVQQGRAYAIWHHYYNSPFNVVAVQVMAKWFYPELFADLDPQATLKALYARHQPIALQGVYWTGL